MLDKALNPRSERLYNMIFFKIIKLIDDSSRQNGKNRTKNNAVNFKIKNKFPESFILIKKEKRRNIQCKSEQNSNKKASPQKKAHKL